MSSIDDLATSLSSTPSSADETAAALSRAKAVAEGVVGAFQSLGADGRAAHAHAVADQIEGITGQQAAVTDTIENAQ
ncbi:hypothetical protein [Natronoglycomyces albus]|uniref:Uncharacterized protein n=1 Tax=Natronoglycomyces albus TaxID=2811108 RepID=A0A895XK90_9ACTN|nr:hypothetical protein [Natronoglycomyces albus]QSB05754.1 hypothetical protein JQS30_02150 [Natronoglycomyces albus]